MKDKQSIKTSMYDFVFGRFEQKKDLRAIGYMHRTFTFSRLKEEADSFSRAFKAHGLKKGDVITLALPNIPAAVSAFYGANKLGLVVSLIHPLAPYCQLRESMQKTGSKLLFSIDVVLDGYVDEALKDGFDILCCSAGDWLGFPVKQAICLLSKNKCKNIKKHKKSLISPAAFLQKGRGIDVEEDFSFDQTRIIMASGGTSDLPKSIELTSMNFNAIAYNTISVVSGKAGQSPNDNKAMIAALPMFHCFGLGVTLHTILAYDYEAVLIPKYSPKAIVSALRKNKNATLISGVPTLYSGILAQKKFEGKHLKKMQCAFCGGDKLSHSLKKRFDDIMIKYGSPCRLDEGYGLTETSGVISVNRRGQEREGSVGKPIGDYLVEAFDIESDSPLKRGETGQLCVAGDVLMQSYLKGKNQDDIMQQTSPFFEHQGNKFVRTGDIGMVDEDGFIFMKSRLKRMFKVSGINVYPAETEQAINRIDGVRECCVLGRHHSYKGAEAVAFVVAEGSCDEQELKHRINSNCRQLLSKWSMPKEIIFVDKLPQTALGKTDTKKLESMLETN